MKGESTPKPLCSPFEVKHEDLLAREKRQRRRFATIVLAAVGLHIPLTPVGKKVFEMVAGTDVAHGFEGSAMVLRPQTDQDKQIV